MCKNCKFTTFDSCEMKVHNQNYVDANGPQDELKNKGDKLMNKLDGHWLCQVCGKKLQA